MTGHSPILLTRPPLHVGGERPPPHGSADSTRSLLVRSGGWAQAPAALGRHGVDFAIAQRARTVPLSLRAYCTMQGQSMPDTSGPAPLRNRIDTWDMGPYPDHVIL